MSEQAPSAYPSYKPAEGDVGTADAPRAPPHASLATQPDEGSDTELGEASLLPILPPTDRGLMPPARALAPDRHCDLAAVTPRHPNAIVAPAPVGVIAFVAEQSPQSRESWRLHSAHYDHAGGGARTIAPGTEGPVDAVEKQ
jgi:hypothetical protein